MRRRIAGEIGDTLFLAEHPPTVTLGKNCAPDELGEGEPVLRSRGVEICPTDRGGKATYHGPGQLVIYPVVSLRERGWGARRFVSAGLEALGAAVRPLGLSPEVRLEPAGLWIGAKKVASVGLRIQQGVSNHGFSLNVNNTLEFYPLFCACGLGKDTVCSLAGELRQEVALDEISAKVCQEFRRVLN